MNTKFVAFVLCGLAIALLSGNACFAAAAQTGPKLSAPAVTLKVWQDSSEQEQIAFLAGFISMLELEKEWQGQKAILPLHQSLAGSWATGLAGHKLQDIHKTVNTYIAANPGKMDKMVVEVMWYELVQPKIKESIPADDMKALKKRSKALRSQR